MVRLIHDCLFSTNLPMIVHSVNCRGGFGSGVAKEVASRYPTVRNAYLFKFEKDGWNLGEIQVVPVSPDRCIANIAGQHAYGYDGKVYASYEAIREGTEKAAEECNQKGLRGFACPKLGCGLGGLEWEQVLPILEKVANDYDIEIHVHYL